MNNLWESEDERRKRLGLQPLQSTPVNQQPVPQFDTTREAVAYAWDKQHPNGGMAKMTGPLGDISYYDENLHKDEKPQQNGVFGNVLKKGEQLASAGLNGLSLGFADEMEGVMGGLGYGLASLNPKWNKSGESFWDAAKRGYADARDNRRNVLAQGQKDMPVAMGIAEAAGSIASNPYGKILGASKTAPLAMKAAGNFKTGIANGLTYGAGVTEDNTPQEYAKNMALGAAGNMGGNTLSNQLYGRNAHPLIRGTVQEAISRGLDTLSNTAIPQKDDDDEWWKKYF